MDISTVDAHVVVSVQNSYLGIGLRRIYFVFSLTMISQQYTNSRPFLKFLLLLSTTSWLPSREGYCILPVDWLEKWSLINLKSDTLGGRRDIINILV